MHTMWSLLRRYQRPLLGAVGVGAAGLISLGPLRSASLDLLFTWRGPVPADHPDFPNEAALVLVEATEPGNWRPFARLLTTLAQVGAEAVVVDLIFTNQLWNGESPELTEAAKVFTRRGRLVLASELMTNWQGPIAVRAIRPLPGGLRHVVPPVSNITVGLANLPADPAGVVRVYYGSEVGGYLPLAFAAAGAPEHPSGGFRLNYYGPPGTLAHYDPSGVGSEGPQAASLQGKTVFLGAAGVDLHRTPFAREPGLVSSGAEIHATAFANLRRGASIRDLAASVWFGEGLLVLSLGLAGGAAFTRWTPRRAGMVGVVAGVVVTLLAFVLFKAVHFYVPYMSIAGVMIPMAIGSSFLPVQSAFISYRSTDKELAFHMAEELERLGVEVYLDLKQKGESGALQDGLFPEIEKRGSFLLVVTPALLTLNATSSTGSGPDWVGEEIARAVGCRKRIVLVYVDDAGARIAAHREQRGSLPVYEAIHTANCRFRLESVLASTFRSPYSLAHLASSIHQLRQRLPWRVRQDWGRRTRQAPDEDSRAA